MICVYILKSTTNDSFYVGSTNNLNRRLSEHLKGKSKYTRNILPVKLVFTQKYHTISGARKIEFWLKKQKDKKFITRIIREGKILKKV